MAVSLLVGLACYLIGSLPFPLLVSRLVKGIDLRQYGSGNMGATNAARVLGRKWFPVVFGLDFGKGALAAWLGAFYLPVLSGGDPALGAALGGLLGVIGHCFPIYVGFRGGVGLAASAGALAVLSPLLLVGAGAGIALLWALLRNMYVGVAAAALAFPAIGWVTGLQGPAVVAVLTVWGILVFAVHFRDVRAWWLGRARGGRAA